jgi:NADH dehydrogenase
VTVPTRRLPAKAVQTLPFVDVIQADITQEGALEDLLQGHDVVINLVAILHGSPNAFDRIHVKLATRLAHACVKFGIPHLLHVSALGAHHEHFHQSPSLYLKSKGQAESAMIEVSQHTHTRLSIVRPSVIFAADDQFINLFALLQKIFPCVPLGCAGARFQPIWVQDVVSALLALMKSPRPLEALATGAPEIYELGGPQILSLKELVQVAGRFVGHERPVISLPLALAKLQGFVMQHLPGKTLMSLDNVASMQVPNTVSGNLPGLKELGILTPHSVTTVFSPRP